MTTYFLNTKLDVAVQPDTFDLHRAGSNEISFDDEVTPPGFRYHGQCFLARLSYGKYTALKYCCE